MHSIFISIKHREMIKLSGIKDNSIQWIDDIYIYIHYTKHYVFQYSDTLNCSIKK